MIVCSCNVFSDTQVEAAIAASAERLRMSKVYASLGCAAQCGRCAHTIKAMLDQSECVGAACRTRASRQPH